MILEYIAENWVKWLFAVCLAVLTAAWKVVSKRLTEEHEKNMAIAEGMQALLRESIVTNYNKWHDRGYCPIYAKESTKRVYQAYHDLGGNDVATQLYKKMLEMPEEPEGENNGTEGH